MEYYIIEILKILKEHRLYHECDFLKNINLINGEVQLSEVKFNQI